MYKKTTHDIQVCVSPVFLDEQSDPYSNHYVWSYNISIENLGKDSVQLKRRNWIITDKMGKTVHVSGDGVLGEQPTLQTGDSFQYTSGVPLTSPSGIMHGSYFMLTDNGETIEIEIPVFSLDSPYDNSSIH